MTAEESWKWQSAPGWWFTFGKAEGKAENTLRQVYGKVREGSWSLP